MSKEFATIQFARFLPAMGKEETTRTRANRGDFGPVFIEKGRQRGRLIALDKVMAVLGISRADVQGAIASYEAAYRQRRPAIVNLEDHQLEIVPTNPTARKSDTPRKSQAVPCPPSSMPSEI